ncbi:retrovirus-related pol polyprotein from transposon TNT 1-94 [Tanacetum coccineum]
MSKKSQNKSGSKRNQEKKPGSHYSRRAKLKVPISTRFQAISSNPDFLVKDSTVGVPSPYQVIEQLMAQSGMDLKMAKTCYHSHFLNISIIMEQAVEQHRLESKTFEVKMNQVLNENERLLEQVINKDIVNIIMNSSVDIASEIFQRDNSVSNQNAPSFDQLFELNELKAQSQEKDMVIKKLKERIKSLSEKMNEDKIKKDLEEIETINIELDHRVSKLIAENEHLKQTYKQLYDSIKPTRIRSKEQCDDLINQEEATVLRDLAEHVKSKYLLDQSLESACRYAKRIQELLTNISKTCPSINNADRKLVAVTQRTRTKGLDLLSLVKPSTSASGSQPSGNTKKDKIQQTPSSTQKNKVEAHPRKVKSSLKIKDYVVEPKGSAHVQHSKLNGESELRMCLSFFGYNKFGNDHVAKILGYGDYHIGNVTISRVYYVEGLGHNLFSVGQFCDSNLEVAFRQHTCFIRNLEGVDLLTGSRGNNLYTLSLGDMMASSPICLLSKASKTKSWLWHRRLSHLNFGAINHLARHGLVRGLPKLKFEKDHLCSACAMGKSKKKPHKPKSEDTNQEKLYLLHMDLCGPMRVASVNGKKYILVIVDDYSRFTWVKFLRSKDEAPDFIIKFLKMIQVRLKVPV